MKKTLCAYFATAALAGSASVASAQIVVNEVSANAPEFVELLVLADGDYTGYTVLDGLQAGNVPGGGFRLAGSYFASLKAGTLITVYNIDDVSLEVGQPAEDTTYDPNNGDFDIVLDKQSTQTGTEPWTLHFDTGLNIGSTEEVIVIGQGGPYAIDIADFPYVSQAGGGTFYDPSFFKFGLAAASTAGTVHHTNTTSDIDLDSPMNYAANGNTFAAPSDYTLVTGSVVFTPATGNTVTNQQYINQLRGVVDNPDAFVADSVAYSDLTPTASSSQLAVTVQNIGASANLNVAGSSISGPDAAKFTVTTQPTGIAPTATGDVIVTFNPGGAAGLFTATLTIASNDTSGDTFDVTLYGLAGNVADFAGLYIDEVLTGPTSDEFVEIVNTTASPMDISGVIVADEDNGTGEGAFAFPASTTLAAGERVVVALGTSSTEPTWLDSVPAGVRVFHETARDPSTWTAANGNTITAVVDVDPPGGTVFLASDDNVCLLVPGTGFFANKGIMTFTACIDGLNINDQSTTAPGPINSNGDTDPQATRVLSEGLPDGQSLYRTSYAPNTASNAFYALSGAISPGAPSIPASVGDLWMQVK